VRRTDILVIGAGQAGLAAGYHLKNKTSSFLLVDGCARIGDSWRKRYDSLLLFTPRSLSALPGLPLKSSPQGYARGREFADYIETYAIHFGLPVELNCGVQKLERVKGKFIATRLDGEAIEAKAVVLSTGGFQKPRIPEFADYISREVKQFTIDSYKNPTQIPPGEVVVVGDGATGRDIASELSASHMVNLSAGKTRRLMPEKVLGVNTWYLLNRFGLLTAPGDSYIGRKLRQMDSFPDRGYSFTALCSRGIKIMQRLTKAEGKKVTFEDSTTKTVNSIIWAVGYKDNSQWVNIPEVKDGKGNFIHQKGLSPIENLFFIGRPWQTSRASALISGVGKDAEMIVNEIISRLYRRK
jgi:putative flavoprotein involved in K+ transport